MERDIRCLCERCRGDYIAAGYLVETTNQVVRSSCDKCERMGVEVEILRLKPRRKIVIVCSPFGGKEENLIRAREYCAREVKAGNIPLAPHLIFPQFLDEATERSKGISFGIEIIKRAGDELHVYETPTDGMQQEIRAAIERGIKVVYMEVE